MDSAFEEDRDLVARDRAIRAILERVYTAATCDPGIVKAFDIIPGPIVKLDILKGDSLLIGSNIAMIALWTSHAALICRQTSRIIACIDRRRIRLECHRLG